MYHKEHYDHLFYRMKQSLPNNRKIYFLFAVIKLLPLFLQVHSGGYQIPSSYLNTLHTYFKFFSLAFYIQNSVGANNIWLISCILLSINILCILILIYYLSISAKVKKIDENYGNVSSLHGVFNIFSIFVFFKYIMLFQYFTEVNFMPIICIQNLIDMEKIKSNIIFTSPDEMITAVSQQCTGASLIIVILLSVVNMIIDLCYQYFLTSRFFDCNIVSNYKWNFYPNPVYSFLFFESFAQMFFILFLNLENKTYKLFFGIYVYFLLCVYLYKFLVNKDFYSSNATAMVIFAFFVKAISQFAQVFIQIFQFGLGLEPNDLNILGLLIIEILFAFLLFKFLHRHDSRYVKSLIASNLNKLNEKNIYPTLNFVLKEFRIFSDVSHKFSDDNLDLFLENYVEHLKGCDDYHCPCKNYIKKVSDNSNTLKTGNTTVVNYTQVRKPNQEEYILNKFFNVLAANIATTIKYTNNVNLNNIKDSQRKKLIYQLRLKLITAVKKLLSYRLEQLVKSIDSIYVNSYSGETKDFIRINFYSANILNNKSFYKTQFMYYEFLAEYFQRNGRGYRWNMIYYFYLKMFSISKYFEYFNTHRQGRKSHAHSGIHLDFRNVMALCVKYYEIEERLLTTAKDFEKFITYFGKEKIVFDKLLDTVRKFKSDYKNVTTYIRHFFKNDKINNLFVSTKIILLFKILQFDIPETLHNKLIIQTHDSEDIQRTHSYIDTNYYIIANYIQGDFLMKFISHELLIVLEFSEDELRDQDFHILMPEKLRKLHKNLIISEIKSKSSYAITTKEIFFVSKRKTCVLFDLQYKVLLNLRGEITLLCVLNLKKPSKDYRVCFACVDDHGEVLALNREFEEYLVLSMKMLELVKIDTEKVILQNMGQRMRTFFKDEENTEFQDQFDYEQYLGLLFGEEFEPLKEKNEKEYKKRYARWEVLKEMNRKTKYYTRYIEIFIKQKTIFKEKIYFLKYSVKITLSLRSIEPHNTTLSLIHAVKISKREMAKLSFYRGDEIYESKSEKSKDDDKLNASRDDLFESQSQISSAVSQLKERNSIRLFRQRRSRFKFLPKSRNILMLMVVIAVLAVASMTYNISSLLMKTTIYKTTLDTFTLNLNVLLFKRNVFYICSGMITLNLMWEDIVTGDEDYRRNTEKLLETKVTELRKVVYDINYLNSKYYSQDINNILAQASDMVYVFNNGYIYTKNNVNLFQEIFKFDAYVASLLASVNSSHTKTQFNVKKYFLFSNILTYQNSLDDAMSIQLSNDDIALFFVIHNLFSKLEPYLESIIRVYQHNFQENQTATLKKIIIIKVAELFAVFLIISTELFFIFIGYEKAKKKMFNLREKVEKNNMELTLKKVEEFIRFSNTFNICSLYFIAELDLKKIEDNNTTKDKDISPERGGTIGCDTPRKKKFQTMTLRDLRDHEVKDSETLIFHTLKDGLGTPSPPGKGYKEIIDVDRIIAPINEDKQKNLMKSIQKLEQIRSIKKIGLQSSKIEKKDSEVSKSSSMDSTNLYCTEILNHLEVPNEITDLEKKNELFSSCIVGTSSSPGKKNISSTQRVNETVDPSSPLKGVLRTGALYKNSSANVNQKVNITDEDDSKAHMIKPKQDDSSPVSSLTRKNTQGGKTPKVKFTDKNVRFYVPVNEVCKEEMNTNSTNTNKVTELFPIIEKNSGKTLGTIFSENEATKIENSTPCIPEKKKEDSDSLAGAYVNTSKSIDKSPIRSEPGEQSHLPIIRQSSFKKSAKVYQDVEIKDFKENDVRKYKLLDQANLITVKKKQEAPGKDHLQKEVIEYKIDSIVHSNCLAKSILIISSGVFIVLYVISIVFSLKFFDRINHAHLYSENLLKKMINLNMLTVKYKLTLIENSHQDDFKPYLSNVQENLANIIKFKQVYDPNVLERANLLEMKLSDENACMYLSTVYLQLLNSSTLSSDTELFECLHIGNQINKNGISNAYMNILNTMISVTEDWKKTSEFTESFIIAKLNDMSFFDAVVDMDYTIRKYDLVLSDNIFKDVNDIFSWIFENENTFSYFSIILNLVFFFFSMIFIIYPIKYVEMMISWLIHKLMKN